MPRPDEIAEAFAADRQAVLDKLAEPLDPARVKMVQSRGGGQNPHLEAWDVKRQANEVFGHDGWAPRLVELRCVGEERWTIPATEDKPQREACRVGYVAIVEVAVDGFPPRSDVGYGDATEYQGSLITCHELAAKEASSDAFKRAMTSLGDQFGLTLYDKQGAFRRQPGRQAARPVDTKPITERAAALALDDETVARVIRFILLDANATIESLRQSDVRKIVEALDFAASAPDDADRQMSDWEQAQESASGSPY